MWANHSTAVAADSQKHGFTLPNPHVAVTGQFVGVQVTSLNALFFTDNYYGAHK